MVASADPVTITHVQPGYGRGRVVVRWRVNDDRVLTWKAALYRSWDQGNVFERVKTPTTVFAEAGTILDDEVEFVDSTTAPLYYLRVYNEVEYFDTKLASPHTNMTRREYGIVRRLMNMKLQAYSVGRDGTMVWLYKRPIDGDPCPNCTDPDSSQSSGSPTCETCHGTGFKGGYGTPYHTWIHRDEHSAINNSDNEAGGPLPDKLEVKITALAFPVLRTGDLIVEPMRDERFVVGADVKVNAFKGEYPIDCTCTVEALRRGDIRFKIEPPDAPCHSALKASPQNSPR